MAEHKKKMGNVAFGGAWSEEILVMDELAKVLATINDAAENCADQDVESEELLAAMLYVRKNIDKGPMLCAAFFKGLRISNQGLRQIEVKRVAVMIRTWAGM